MQLEVKNKKIKSSRKIIPEALKGKPGNTYFSTIGTAKKIEIYRIYVLI